MTTINELAQLRDATIAHWTALAVSTAPIDHIGARKAATALAIELTGRTPRAVLVFASPREARLAAHHFKAQILAHDTQEESERQLRTRILSCLKRLASSTLSVRIAGAIDTAVVSAVRAAISAPVPMAVEVTPSQPRGKAEAAAAARALIAQLEAQAGTSLKSLTRARPVASLSRNVDLGFRHEMHNWLGLAAALDYMTARSPAAAIADPDATLTGAFTEVCAHVGNFWIYPDIVICCDRPQILHRDPEGRAHATDGPAIVYRDGFEVYASRGTHIPTRIHSRPAEITVAEIEQEASPEVRRVMLAKMGIDRYLAQSQAEKIDEDETGILWRRRRTERFRIGGWRSEMSRDRTLCFVEVVNGTPEPDGSYKHYYLRVPPNMQTAREAVAWTYGLSEPAYQPELRT